MAKHGKKYEEASKLIDPQKEYDPKEAIALLKKASFVKFDETVEVHMHMGLDPRHADQQVRGVASLPHGLGKQVRVIVFTQGEGARVAQESGADFAGCEDLIKKIDEGWLDFDVAIATPDVMGKVSKLGKILGRKGLMPNPKSGTIVQPADIARAINEAKKGRVDFRLDKTSVIHVSIGKASFEEKKLFENFAALIETVVKAKPRGAKGQYVKSISISTSMGPGVNIDLKPALDLKVG